MEAGIVVKELMNIKPEQIFVIIPSYNEGKVIRNTVYPLIQEGYSVVVVDDCSNDNTREVLVGLPLYYLTHLVNQGQGAAIQTGIDFALMKNAAYAVTFDADGQHNHKEIPLLFGPIMAGRADITLGTRFKLNNTKQIPRLRKIILKGAVLINGLLTGLWLSDAHNGFRAMNRTALLSIKLRENRMAHASEILTQIRQVGLRYEEVPVNITYTEYSKMKGQRHLNAINILIDLLLTKFI